MYDENRDRNFLKKGFGTKYKLDMANIIDYIKKRKTSYVKCIAPNFEKQQGEWTDCDVIRQLNGIGIENYINFKKQ